jgi:hypothetical protein
VTTMTRMSSVKRIDPAALETAVVLHVEENVCRVIGDDAIVTAEYAPQFPSPRVERISPGHRVALATAPDGRRVVLWRWYDAVVVGFEGESVRLWEPAHGEVLATARTTAEELVLGSRAYLSAGLPGAGWWVASPVLAAEVELDEVAALYTQHDLWDAALAGSGPHSA